MHAIHHAALGGHDQMIDVLMSNGADIQHQDAKVCVLSSAWFALADDLKLCLL